MYIISILYILLYDILLYLIYYYYDILWSQQIIKRQAALDLQLFFYC